MLCGNRGTGVCARTTNCMANGSLGFCAQPYAVGVLRFEGSDLVLRRRAAPVLERRADRLQFKTEAAQDASTDPTWLSEQPEQ